MMVIRTFHKNWYIVSVKCRVRPPHSRGLYITQRRTTVGRTPPDEWSARRRDLYVTTHNVNDRHPCSRWDCSLQCQQVSGRRSTPLPRGHRDRQLSYLILSLMPVVSLVSISMLVSLLPPVSLLSMCHTTGFPTSTCNLPYGDVSNCGKLEILATVSPPFS
jgi:hypothetical protein